MLKVIGNKILGRILPQETMYGRIHLPQEFLAKRGTGNINFEPIEVVVVQVGSAVREITVGMRLTLDSVEYNKLDDEHIIFPEHHYGKYYWTDSGKQLTSAELKRMQWDDNTQVMLTKEGRQYRVDADPTKNKIVGGVILYAKEA